MRMGVSPLECRRCWRKRRWRDTCEGFCQYNEEEVEVMVMRRLEWFGHVKIRHATETIRAVAEMKMEGQRPGERPMLLGEDAVRRDLKACNIREEWATDTGRERWKGLGKTHYPAQGGGAER